MTQLQSPRVPENKRAVQMVGPWLEDPTPVKLAELIEREFGGFVPPKMFDD